MRLSFRVRTPGSLSLSPKSPFNERACARARSILKQIKNTIANKSFAQGQIASQRISDLSDPIRGCGTNRTTVDPFPIGQPKSPLWAIGKAFPSRDQDRSFLLRDTRLRGAASYRYFPSWLVTIYDKRCKSPRAMKAAFEPNDIWNDQ